jgi:RNA polymerase-binding transcription factor DksA
MAAKKQVAKKQAPKKQAPRKQAAKKSAAKVATKKAAAKPPAAKKPAAKQSAAKKPAAPRRTSGKARPAKAAAATPATPTAAKRANTTTTKSEERAATVHELPKPRFNKDGFGYTKDFDLAFVREMYDLLQEERVTLTGQAKRLEDEAHQLVEEAEMGDVQFDDEGGEGDTMVVERERDLALSAQAREAVAEIDAAIDRIMSGTYGYSTISGLPIPRERLEAIPWSAELVEEKVGGIGRR